MKKEKDPTFKCCFYPSFLAVEHQSLSQKKKKRTKKKHVKQTKRGKRNSKNVSHIKTINYTT